GRRHGGGGFGGGPLLCALGPGKHGSPRDPMGPAAHQREPDPGLGLLGVKGAARVHPPRQRRAKLLPHIPDPPAPATRGARTATLDREKGLGHGHCDLLGIERGYATAAADHLQARRRSGGWTNSGRTSAATLAGGRRWLGVGSD